MLDLKVRSALIVILSLSLLLIIARQILDFLGRLWLPIVFNFLQIILLIFGLFGIVQYRISFLIGFIVWSLLWIGWNVFLICFYLSVGVLNRNSLLLSFGTRGAHSFWVEHTPLCQNAYDLNAQSWISKDCLLEYHYVEVVTAGLHILLALLSVILALIFAVAFKRKWREVTYGTLRSHGRQPKVTVEFAETPERATSFVSAHPNGRVPNGHSNANQGYLSDSLYDASSGYMNTSFESSPTPANKANGYMPKLDNSGQLFQKNYGSERKRKSKRSKDRRLSYDGSVLQQNGHFQPQSSPSGDELPPPDIIGGRQLSRSRDNFSVATTADALDAPVRPPQRPRGRSSSASRPKREERERRKAARARSASPSPLRSSHTQGSRLSPDFVDPNAAYERQYRQRGGSVKQKPHKYQSTGASQKLGGSQQFISDDPEMSMHRYVAEPRRLSVAEPRGIRNSSDSAMNSRMQEKTSKKRGSKHEINASSDNVTSLISFDPKSNTLIRYHDHLARSQETVLNTTQGTEESSRSSFPPPPEPLPQNFDQRISPVVMSHPPPLPSSTSMRSGPLTYPEASYQMNGGVPTQDLGPPSSDRVSYDSGFQPSMGQNGHGSEWSSTSESQTPVPRTVGGYQPSLSYQSNGYGLSDPDPIYKPNFMRKAQHTPAQNHYHPPADPHRGISNTNAAFSNFLNTYESGLDDSQEISRVERNAVVQNNSRFLPSLTAQLAQEQRKRATTPPSYQQKYSAPSMNTGNGYQEPMSNEQHYSRTPNSYQTSMNTDQHYSRTENGYHDPMSNDQHYARTTQNYDEALTNGFDEAPFEDSPSVPIINDHSLLV